MNLFTDYVEALEPDSLFEVIPRNIMQVLMRGFFYSDRVGMTLLYKDKKDPAPSGQSWHHFEPVYEEGRNIRDYWNPFCRKLREFAHCNRACMKCDEDNAERVFDAAKGKVDKYRCHMHLWDFAYDFKVAGKPIGVFFAGQMVEKLIGESLFDNGVHPKTADRLEEVFSRKALDSAISQAKRDVFAATSPEDKSRREQEVDKLEAAVINSPVWQLKQLLPEKERSSSDIQSFEEGFEAFCSAVQQTIDELYESKLKGSTERAILKVNEFLRQRVSIGPDAWISLANKILTELEEIVSGRPIFLLVRRRSHYEVLAASPRSRAPFIRRALNSSETAQNSHLLLRVSDGFGVPERKWHCIALNSSMSDAWRKQLPWIPRKPLWAYRLEEQSGASAPLSVIFVVVGDPPEGATRESKLLRMDLVQRCADAVAYHAHLGTLSEHQQAQQEDFAHRVSFTGHHLKTPLQNAFSTLRDIARTGDQSPDLHQRRIDLCRQVRKQLEEALADALMLQATAKARPEPVDVYQLLCSLVSQFEARAAERNNFIRLALRPAGSCLVNSITHHLRAAFTNVLDNAVKYSFANKEIRITFQRYSDRQLQVVIRNTGVGLSTDTKPSLFKYAQRRMILDSKRERPGQGIGLNQTSRFLEVCGGSFHLESLPIGITRDGTAVYHTDAEIILPIILK